MPDHYDIVFDGGSLGNPGHGYGSFEIRGPRGYLIHEALDFAHLGDHVSNNQAEYRTLISALSRLIDELGPSVADSSVTVHGDSLLVVNQVAGTWKVKNADLKPLRDDAAHLLSLFRQSALRWHQRRQSVRILGH